MANGVNDNPAKKQIFKTVYLDVTTLKAFDYLKTQRPGAGLRFSAATLMREMLNRLAADPASMLRSERYAARGQERGRSVSIALSASDIELFDRLTAYYQEHAKPSRRVRDNQPKLRRLPLSRLFADFLRDQASALAWTPTDA